jgi:3-oxoacyl-[acyl-carrier protein] reductase
MQGRKDRIALVMGANKGIGLEIASQLGGEGIRILVGARDRDRGQAAAATLHAEGVAVRYVPIDLTNPDTIAAAAADIEAREGRLDILVNNAGITRDNLSFRMSLEEWQKVLDINLSAAFFAARTVGRDMIRKRTGSIINMASVVGIHGNGGQANYSASKAGLIGMTKSLAMETASRGVRVNAVAPGYIATDMTAGLPDKVKEAFIEKIPLKRMGTPQDVAAAVLFLASDDSVYITGQVIPVDGGLFT